MTKLVVDKQLTRHYCHPSYRVPFFSRLAAIEPGITSRRSSAHSLDHQRLATIVPRHGASLQKPAMISITDRANLNKPFNQFVSAAYKNK